MLNVYPEHEKDIECLSSYFTERLQSLSINNIHPYYLKQHSTLDLKQHRCLNYDRRTSIIDDPEEKLSLDIIDFDGDSNLALINTVLRDSSVRFKELLVVNRGVGGGKTRSLEELKMLANERIENCLAVAITYNVDWTLDLSEFSRIVEKLYPDEASQKYHVIDVGVVFSVITRITSMIYGIPFDVAKRLYSDNLTTFPKISFDSFHLVLVAFINSIVGELRLAGRTIDNFVLLIDETASVADLFKSKYSVSDTDFLRIARSVALSELLATIAKVNTALIIASLDYSTLHVSRSSRPYTAIALPERLNSADVYVKWWAPLLHRHGLTVPEDQVLILKRFAAACDRSPRTTELFVKALVEYLQQSDGTLSPNAYTEILADVLSLVKSKYPDLDLLPKGLYMHALLFAYDIRADDAVMGLVQIGMYSNSIKKFNPRSRYILTPVTSFILLTAAGEEELERDGANRLAKLIVDMYRCFLERIASNKVGFLLENIMNCTFKAKLICDASYPAGELSFADLLCIKGEVGDVGPAFHYKYRLNLALPKGPGTREVLLPSYHEDYRGRVGFYKVLTDPANLPSAIDPYVLFNSDSAADRGNSFDFIIAAYTGEGSPPLLLFIEYKSVKPKDPPGAAVAFGSLKDMSERGDQYLATRQQLMDEPLPGGIDASTGLLGLIRQNGADNTCKEPWVYVYMSTDSYYTKPFAVGNCLLLGPTQVNAFLGPFQGIYEACRISLK